MIGGISKVRPCGHHHYYKYAHCKTQNDLGRVAATKTKAYSNDELTDEGRFYFPLDNLTDIGASTFSGNKKLKIFDDKLKNIKWAEHMFTGTALEKIEIENTGAKYAMVAVPGIQMTPSGAVDYKIKFLNSTNVSSSFQQTAIRAGSNIQLYAPKATTMSSLFEAYGMGGYRVLTSKINIEVDCRNVVNANKFAYYNSMVDELSFPIDEDGNHTFGSGKPEVVRIYTTFPKLKTGKLMFDKAVLTKNYVLAILHDLPNWFNDSGSHEITLGIHVDHKYDPEVNIALKKCQNSYITPIEDFGASLPETITEDKGWTLTIYWNGTATENAYPAPTV
jgi:hypothetical protein